MTRRASLGRVSGIMLLHYWCLPLLNGKCVALVLAAVLQMNVSGSPGHIFLPTRSVVRIAAWFRILYAGFMSWK